MARPSPSRYACVSKACEHVYMQLFVRLGSTMMFRCANIDQGAAHSHAWIPLYSTLPEAAPTALGRMFLLGS